MYDVKADLVVKRQFGRSGEYGLFHHCHYSHVPSDRIPSMGQIDLNKNHVEEPQKKNPEKTTGPKKLYMNVQ